MSSRTSASPNRSVTTTHTWAALIDLISAQQHTVFSEEQGNTGRAFSWTCWTLLLSTRSFSFSSTAPRTLVRYQDPTSTPGRRSTPTWCVNLSRSTSPAVSWLPSLLQHNNLQLSICTWQLTESRRNTVSTAGTWRKCSGKVSLSAARARSTCTSLLVTVLLGTTSPTSDLIPWLFSLSLSFLSHFQHFSFK